MPAVNHFGWKDGEEPSTTRVPSKTSLSSLVLREVTTASPAPGSACARDLLAALAFAAAVLTQGNSPTSG